VLDLNRRLVSTAQTGTDPLIIPWVDLRIVSLSVHNGHKSESGLGLLLSNSDHTSDSGWARSFGCCRRDSHRRRAESAEDAEATEKMPRFGGVPTRQSSARGLLIWRTGSCRLWDGGEDDGVGVVAEMGTVAKLEDAMDCMVVDNVESDGA